MELALCSTGMETIIPLRIDIGNSLIRSTYDMDAYYYSEITKRNTKNLENREQMKTKG